MGLNAALKDRARVVDLTPLPTKVEGKTITTQTTGSWFRARLELPAGAKDETYARKRTVTTPTLMYGFFDEDHGVVKLDALQRIEVDSPQLGRSVWEMTADPAPMRKKSRVIGWTVTIQRVEDHEFVPRLP